MAKLCAHYSLCPLIDQTSLLGIAEDSTSGCVVVTLGKSIVIRYKVRVTIIRYLLREKTSERPTVSGRIAPNLWWVFCDEEKIELMSSLSLVHVGTLIFRETGKVL
jgi:hypothetical protein